MKNANSALFPSYHEKPKLKAIFLSHNCISDWNRKEERGQFGSPPSGSSLLSSLTVKTAKCSITALLLEFAK
jgi:hypothetical protein